MALPVIGGATALKCLRLWQHGLPEGSRGALAVGAAAAFVSTLGSGPVIGLVQRDSSLLPFAAYRVAPRRRRAAQALAGTAGASQFKRRYGLRVRMSRP